MSKKKRKASEKQNDQDATRILQSFLNFQDKGLDEFCRFLMHCGITLEDPRRRPRYPKRHPRALSKARRSV
jgi:hypothetical protein